MVSIHSPRAEEPEPVAEAAAAAPAEGAAAACRCRGGAPLLAPTPRRTTRRTRRPPRKRAARSNSSPGRALCRGTAIKLIVGLGNPGAEYEATRHNAGFWFVEELARRHGGSFRHEAKHQGELARVRVGAADLWLLKPQDLHEQQRRPGAERGEFLQGGGGEILVAYDELDFPPGTVRLKQGGGAAGHNGSQGSDRAARRGLLAVAHRNRQAAARGNRARAQPALGGGEQADPRGDRGRGRCVARACWRGRAEGDEPAAQPAKAQDP